MIEGIGTARTSSARRRRLEQSSVFRLAALLGLVLAMLLTARLCSRPEPTPGPLREPNPTVVPQATPTATATPTSAPRLVQAESGWVDAELSLSPTPTLFVPTIPSPRRRQPRPTPSISQCAAYRWTAVQVFTPSAQVKIDIRVDNRCPYDLGPNNLLFDITGWRDGGRVQSVRGSPFETIRRGWTGDLSIGLPGSLDWYDEIEVRVFD
jgi:hypothetical protein